LAKVYAQQKHIEDALDCYKHAKSSYRLKGQDVADVDVELINGHIHRLKEEHMKSLMAYESVWNSLKDTSNGTNVMYKHRIPEVLRYMAHEHMEMGEDGLALRRLEESLQISKRSSKSLDIAEDLSLMGDIYLGMGEIDEALRCVEESLSVHRSQLGQTEQAAEALEKAGHMRKQLGDHEIADGYYEEALHARETLSSGSDDVKIASLMQWMAELKVQMQQLELALSLFNECLEMRKRMLGEDHLDVASTFHGIGMAHCHNGKYDESMDNLETALRIRSDRLGQQDPQVADSLHALGFVYNQRGDAGRAVELLLDALRIWKQLGNAAKAVSTLTEIGHVYKDSQQVGLASKCYQECIQLLRQRPQVGGENSDLQMADLNFFMGETLGQEQYEDAFAYYDEALKTYVRLFGEYDMKVASVHQSMGALCAQYGDPRRARDYYTRYIRIKETNDRREDIDQVRALLKLGDMDDRLGNRENARSSWQEAYQIYKINNFDDETLKDEMEERLGVRKAKPPPSKGGGLFDHLRQFSKGLSDEVTVVSDMRSTIHSRGMQRMKRNSMDSLSHR